jgi:hypothetical protein
MAILETFEKQPGEIRAFDIDYAEYLARNGTSARAVDPIEYQIQEGITLVAALWVDEGGFVKLYFDRGVHRKKYKATVWLNTAGGERLEADIVIKVKDS